MAPTHWPLPEAVTRVHAAGLWSLSLTPGSPGPQMGVQSLYFREARQGRGDHTPGPQQWVPTLGPSPQFPTEA